MSRRNGTRQGPRITPLAMAEQRLALVASICSDVANSVGVMRDVLMNDAEDVNVVYLACDALTRLGMALDRAKELAGDESGGINSPDRWLLSPSACDMLAAIKNGGAA